ncbi:hypothetical protein [Pedobacter africanus]|uniref:Uncharacterized protein n=1 Tax=Pedobacter africanus TaxID=151894 RepID=A0A1W2B0E9_9SPHI|nr:hypothetical protein [Pedobacter africanus]SMC66270.1 hypothetical protein SAMN04488524_1807 [Pedobacter africanus]
MSRLLIYTKDVQRITGKGKTAAQNLITAIKRQLKIERYSTLTIREFCDYMRLDVEAVQAQLN